MLGCTLCTLHENASSRPSFILHFPKIARWICNDICRAARVLCFSSSFNFDYIRPDDAAGREKKYFWRVYDKARGAIAFYIDGKDTSRANWMRYVLPAYRRSVQVMFPVSNPFGPLLITFWQE